MYKGKPVIIGRRPFWRNPLFPWGWYSLTHDRINSKRVKTDGYYKPGDNGGGGIFVWKEK